MIASVDKGTHGFSRGKTTSGVVILVGGRQPACLVCLASRRLSSVKNSEGLAGWSGALSARQRTQTSWRMSRTITRQTAAQSDPQACVPLSTDANAYGLYLACHGDEDQTVLSGLGWTMGRDDIHGNWRFVFLDACYSAAGTGWSNQFNIYNYSQSRAFLGWSDTVEGGNSTDFSSAFFPEVIAGNHSNNIRDAAVWAADQVPGYHTAPIKFIGDRTYRGFV